MTRPIIPPGKTREAVRRWLLQHSHEDCFGIDRVYRATAERDLCGPAPKPKPRKKKGSKR